MPASGECCLGFLTCSEEQGNFRRFRAPMALIFSSSTAFESPSTIVMNPSTIVLKSLIPGSMQKKLNEGPKAHPNIDVLRSSLLVVGAQLIEHSRSQTELTGTYQKGWGRGQHHRQYHFTLHK